MTDTIHIQIDRADGSLQRLIGLVERRGFHIDGMSLSDDGAVRRVQMQVRGRDAGRSAEVLGRQIDRMIGVTRVSGPASSGSTSSGSGAANTVQPFAAAFQTEVAA